MARQQRLSSQSCSPDASPACLLLCRLGVSSQDDGKAGAAAAVFAVLQRQNAILADHPHAEQYSTLQACPRNNLLAQKLHASAAVLAIFSAKQTLCTLCSMPPGRQATLQALSKTPAVGFFGPAAEPVLVQGTEPRLIKVEHAQMISVRLMSTSAQPPPLA